MKVARPTPPSFMFTSWSWPVPPSNGRVSSGESRLMRTRPAILTPSYVDVHVLLFAGRSAMTTARHSDMQTGCRGYGDYVKAPGTHHPRCRSAEVKVPAAPLVRDEEVAVPAACPIGGVP